MEKISRNDPCPCGSGRKYKHCCAPRDRAGDEIERSRIASIGLVGKAVEIPPSTPAQYCSLALAQVEAGRMDDAISSWQAALRIDPDFSDAIVNLGIVLYGKGKLNEAVALFRKVVERNARFAEAYNNLGNALAGLGKLDDAAGYLRKAIAVDPDYALAYTNLGNVLRRQGNAREAIRRYRRAVDLQRDDARAHYNLGTAYSDFGQNDEAAASFRRAVGLDPGFAAAHNNLGVVLLEMGKVDEAIASVEAALSINPDDIQAHFNLHSLRLDATDPEPSIRCLRRVVELAPEDALARFNLGMLLDYSGDSAAAAEHLRLAAEGTPLARANVDSYRYIRSAGGKLPTLIGVPLHAFRIAADTASKPGLVLEFGVRFGTSIRQIASLVGQEVHGFDSFEGLPEAWHREPSGSYSTMGAVPAVPKQVILHKGWFADTLPAFLRQHPGPVRIMNVDCDLYSSTRTILELLADRVVPGTVIVFDEYLGYEGWRDGEFRAFQEAVSRFEWSYDYLCFSTKQVVVRIK